MKHMTTVAALVLAMTTGTAATADPITTQPTDVAAMKAERVKTLKQATDLAQQLYSQGIADVEKLLVLQKQLVDAKLAAAGDKPQRSLLLIESVDLAKKQEALAESRMKAGLCSPLDVAESKAERLRVEIQLAEESTR